MLQLTTIFQSLPCIFLHKEKHILLSIVKKGKRQEIHVRLIEDRCEDVTVDQAGCRNTANDCPAIRSSWHQNSSVNWWITSSSQTSELKYWCRVCSGKSSGGQVSLFTAECSGDDKSWRVSRAAFSKVSQEARSKCWSSVFMKLDRRVCWHDIRHMEFEPQIPGGVEVYLDTVVVPNFANCIPTEWASSGDLQIKKQGKLFWWWQYTKY